MANINHYSSKAEKRQNRVRARLFGTTERPRLSVHRTNKFLYLQLIDDTIGKTLGAASDIKRKSDKKAAGLTKTEATVGIAQQLFEQMKSKKISSVVFDRGSFRYHGRVKAVVDELRKLGVKV